MNKKIYIGMAAFGVAASFWACGSGDILEPNAGDDVMGIVVSNEGGDTSEVGDPSIIWDVMTKENCPRCFEGSVSSSSRKTQPVRSSSSSGGSNPQSATSSSDDGGSIVIKSSSSSATPGSSPSVSSSSKTVNPGVSSSSGGGSNPGPSSDFGTCSPARTVISKGDTVSWILKLKDPTQMISATTTWKALGGDPETNKASGMNGRTQNVKYIASGQYTASATVSVGPANYNISCPAIQVNGEPITGCVCAPEGVTGAVNYLKTPDVKWTVTGCKTGATVMTYSWDGGAAGAETSFTKTFSAATASAAPTLFVANNDNTLQEVACTPVKVTEGEEFKIETTQDKAVFKESGSYAISANLPSGWHNTDTECNVYCNASTSNFTVTIDEIELSGKVSGQTYVAKGGMPVAHTVDGYSIPVKVEIPAGDSVSCGVNW